MTVIYQNNLDLEGKCYQFDNWEGPTPGLGDWVYDPILNDYAKVVDVLWCLAADIEPGNHQFTTVIIYHDNKVCEQPLTLHTSTAFKKWDAEFNHVPSSAPSAAAQTPIVETQRVKISPTN